MELTGRRLLRADRDTTFKALHDAGVLRASIPGCEALESAGGHAFSFTVARVLQTVHARFRGTLRFEDMVPAESCTLHFDADDGEGGFARGRFKLKLSSEAAHTAVDYELAAQAGGRIAQVGNRLLESAARKALDDFFIAFEKALAGMNFSAPGGETVPDTTFSTLQHAMAAAILAALVASVAYTLR